MDYTKQSLMFKIKKAVRYIQIYGVSRTLVKIRGQYHTYARTASTPKLKANVFHKNASIGIIGCGNFSYCNIAYYLQMERKGLLRWVMDTNLSKALSLCGAYKSSGYTDVLTDITSDPNVKLVYIASNHASHAEYAISCLENGKDIHIEKPHIVNRDQLYRLLAAINLYKERRVFLGFNRPRSRLFKKLISAVSEQEGPLMINWFIAGHEIPADHWYYDESEGGRIMGNLCHWTDLTLRLVGINKAFPCVIKPNSPTDAKSDFVFSVLFADNSCASITFSAKGHTFEGVREVLNLHRGSLIANLTDFQSLRLEVSDKSVVTKLFYRDHGHKDNILNSLFAVRGEDARYVYLTGSFLLAFRDAMSQQSDVVVYDDYLRDFSS